MGSRKGRRRRKRKMNNSPTLPTSWPPNLASLQGAFPSVLTLFREVRASREHPTPVLRYKALANFHTLSPSLGSEPQLEV
jgi:hypothetical protein